MENVGRECIVILCRGFIFRKDKKSNNEDLYGIYFIKIYLEERDFFLESMVFR